MDELKLFKLLSDKNRYHIFMMLLIDTYCVCDIEQFLEMKQANVSKHLAQFKALDLVETFQKNKWVHYKLSTQAFRNLKYLITYIKKSKAFKHLELELTDFTKNKCN